MRLAKQYASINTFDRLSQPLEHLNILRTPHFESVEKGRSRLSTDVSPSNKENNAKSFKSLINS